MIVIVIVAVIIGAMLLGGVVRRGAARSGDRYGRRVRADRLGLTLEELGATLVVRAPDADVRGILDRIVAQDARRFTALDDGAYGLRFIDHDDGVVRLVTDPDGTRMQVESSREYMGMPKTSGFWADLRALVTAAAAARGIATAPGPVLGYERREHGGSAAVWELVR